MTPVTRTRTGLTRRQLLARGAVAGVGLTAVGRLGTALVAPGAAIAAVPDRFTTPLPALPVITDADVTLTARATDVQLLEGAPTRMWTYNGTFPGPLIRRPAGQRTTVTLRHELPEAGELTLHHHGAHAAPEHDGQPRPEVMIAPGEERTYVYELMEDGEPERAATQFYHDHTHFHTGRNTWMGLQGLFIVEDDFEASLPLPRGEHELPLVITDRAFGSDNQLLDRFTAPDRESWSPVESLGADKPPFDEIPGMGDVYLVNGAPHPYVDVAARRYRLRILNGSNWRSYNLSLTGGVQLVQIGTESGLLPKPVTQGSVRLGPAERADVIVDFTGLTGRTVELVSDGSRPSHALRDLSGAAAFTEIMQFRVGEPAADDSAIPTSLRPLPEWAAGLSEVPDRIWAFGLGTDDAGRVAWTINGRAFDHARVDARPELGSTETWALVNTTPYAMTHFIHIHDVDWRVISRNGAAPDPGEDGLKETFRIDPGEVLVIGSKLTDHLGPYMLHCHMLEHEDHGMMATFEVVEPGQGDRPADALDALTPRERACVEDVLAQVRRRPGRAAKVRKSPAADAVAAGAAPVSSLICHVQP